MSDTVLHLIFTNEDEKKVTLKPKNFRANLAADTVRNTMETISELDLFQKDNISQYKNIEGAKYVVTTEDVIF